MSSLLRTLAGSEGFPRVSIYLPTHPTYPDCLQDPIRLSNSLKEVERQLTDAGWRESDVAALVSEAAKRDKDDLFWRFQDEGLAVFIEDGATQWLKLSAQVPEVTVVAARYHIRPLIPILRDKGIFHVLTATEAGARLYNASESQIHEVQLEGVPAGLEELRQRTGFDADVGFHSRDRGQQVGGSAAPKYAALGDSGKDYQKTLLDQFTLQLAKAVDAHLAASEAPLVLAALPQTLGLLSAHLDYPHVAEEKLSIDPGHLSEADLHKRAWTVAEPILTRDRKVLRDRLRNAVEGAQPDYATHLGSIIRATDEGRVDTVFVSPGEPVWGIYDPSHRVARIDRTPNADNEDLLNLVALRTLAQGGDVRRLPDDLRETVGPVAALYRY